MYTLVPVEETDEKVILLIADFYGRPPYPSVDTRSVYIDPKTQTRYVELTPQMTAIYDEEHQAWLNMVTKHSIGLSILPYTDELFTVLDSRKKQYYELMKQADREIDELHKYEHWYKP